MSQQIALPFDCEALKDKWRLFRTSSQAFCEFFLKDSLEHKFIVPTRDYRVFNETPAFQAKIFKILDTIDKTQRFCLASPRGFLKSTTCSIEFPLQVALFGDFHDILIVSNSESLAIKFLRTIKVNLESNERILRYFGKQQSDKWTENHLILTNGVQIRAVGWGGQIRGFHPDLIILDDIESDETVISEDVTTKIRNWINRTALNAVTVNGSVVFVGTLISRTSVLFDWITNPPDGWLKVFNQAYINGIEEPSHELWPEVWPHARLQQRKSEIGTWAFSSEFMNTPIPSEGNRFNPSTFRYFEESDLKGKQLGMYIAIDPAFSENKDSDYGVILQCYHDSNDNLYVDRYFRKHTTSGELIRNFKSIYRMSSNLIRAVGIEDVGPQRSFYDTLVNECYQEGIYPPFKKLTGMISTNRGQTRNKKDRITYSIQPRLEAGKIYFRRDQRELIEELTLFPESAHDDLCDSLSYVISLLEPFQDYSQEIQDDNTGELELATNRGMTGYGDSYA